MSSISIVINNFNYGRYLKAAINSALNQSLPALEIIVVDDGSTDNSRDIIAQYGDKIIPILKNNGGQASAFNEGFNAATGDWILFLDADDVLYPDALKSLFQELDPSIARIEYKLDIINNDGVRLSERKMDLLNGNPLEGIEKRGRLTINPTSSHLFTRRTLSMCLPLPEEKYRICADLGLIARASACGSVRSLDQVLAAYRIHGENMYSSNRADFSISASQRHVNNSFYLREEIEPIMISAQRVMPPDFGVRNMQLIESLRRISSLTEEKTKEKRLLIQLPGIYLKGLKYSKGFVRKMRAISLFIYSVAICIIPISWVNVMAKLRMRLGIT